IARSVATWSLRERAVCSLPPTGPAIAVSRRSIAMWMSSSPCSNAKRSSLSSRSTASSPASSASRSALVRMPRSASMRACARASAAGGPPSPLGLAPERGREGLGDARDPALLHAGEEGQRQRARGHVLAHGELAGSVSEALAVVAQQVDGGHVGLALDAGLGERTHGLLPVG